ncbi:MAG: FAD-binding protein, partial [Emcibacter sp.]|nr:FAD-binding protein [Emcibacter sp.]
MSDFYDFDVLIIGSGAAGLTLGLKVADHAKVAILSKNKLHQGSTSWAQGGIAAVLDNRDTTESHIEDTMIAGAGLCHRDTVTQVVENGRVAIDWLVEQGVTFTKNTDVTKDIFVEGDYHLTKEGGHSFRRVVHATDATGKAVQISLENQARNHPNITLFENHMTV